MILVLTVWTIIGVISVCFCLHHGQLLQRLLICCPYTCIVRLAGARSGKSMQY